MIDLKTILNPYSAELAHVQTLIDSKLESDAPQLAEISRYLSGLGGKKVRPLLACALALGLGIDLNNKESRASQQLFVIAAGIEMIHMATLLHDDIIDKSLTRRHKPSAYAKYGLDDTLLTGDFLLVRAFGLCGQLDKRLVSATELACVALTEGETLEKRLSSKQVEIDFALLIGQKKTAALFELASFSAAYLADLSEDSINAAAEFGRNLGIAFQVVDDILDVISDDSVLGKPSGQDLREQKPSVINIMWLQSGSELAQQLLGDPKDCSEEWVARSLKEIKASAVISKAKDLARVYIDQSLSRLETLKQSSKASGALAQKHFSALEKLIEFALNRIH